MSDNTASNELCPEITVRQAVKADIDFICRVENECFAHHRQSSRRSIANSIQSAAQHVVIAEITDSAENTTLAGAAVAFLYKRKLRIYSIAVSPQFRRMGVGEALMRHILELARQLEYRSVTLEADSANTSLVKWYQKHGFEITRFLENYYLPGESAYRMIRSLTETDKPAEGIVIVVDDESVDLGQITDMSVFTARDYLSVTSFSHSANYHVLNLCSSYKTHSLGYYVSLLATARNHRITPSVMTVTDSSNLLIAQSILDEIDKYLDEKLRKVSRNFFELTVVMGRATEKKHSELARKLFTLFELPFFTISLEHKGSWRVKKIIQLGTQQVIAQWPEILKDALAAYQSKKRYRRTRLRNFKYDLAMLINENEKTPPSCPMALEKFRRAAEEVGFFVEFITKTDKRRICEFDALFIRETTALNNHTYSIARHAYTEGLVVIDDPWSILLCSNKVYLHERLAHADVRQPRGWLLTKKSCTKEFLKSLAYPLVLKLPESSFSMGVFRVDSPEQLETKARQMFAISDLIIAQQYMTSDYDWRIGVLDKQPLFACKYYMASGHWQIYNWQTEQGEEFSGKHETVPVNQVPADVLKTAIKATSLIGDGLYGVDLKEIDRKAYVIEVNDNPNIDAGVEDALLGDELYKRIMNSIFNRVEAERGQVRYLS